MWPACCEQGTPRLAEHPPPRSTHAATYGMCCTVLPIPSLRRTQVVFNRLGRREVRVIAGLMLQETVDRARDKG